MVTFITGAHLLPEEQEDWTCNLPLPKDLPCLTKSTKFLFTDYSAPTSIWSLIEALLAIVSACLPTLRPLFQGYSPESISNLFHRLISLGFSHREQSNGSERIYTNTEGSKDEQSFAMHERISKEQDKSEIMMQRSFAVEQEAV